MGDNPPAAIDTNRNVNSGDQASDLELSGKAFHTASPAQIVPSSNDEE
jgi:hypothetical protein